MLRRWISAERRGSDADPHDAAADGIEKPFALQARKDLRSFTLRMSFVSGVTMHAAATTGPPAPHADLVKPTTRRSLAPIGAFRYSAKARKTSRGPAPGGQVIAAFRGGCGLADSLRRK